MTETKIYRPVTGSGFRFGSHTLWQAADHLLLIRTRAFREIYTRIYWADIQTVVLYPLSRPGGPMLAFEIFCLLVLGVSAPFAGVLPGSILAGLFVLIYTSWRFTRPGWACQISTRISTQRFALANTASASRRIVEHIKARTHSVQRSIEETTAQVKAHIATNQKAPEPGRTRLPLYAIAFGLALLAPLHSAVAVLYYLALIPLLFLRRDFEFPFSVRAATVMSLILAVLYLAEWLIYLRDPLFIVGRPYRVQMASEFQVLRALAGLFGIIAIYWQSLEHSRYQPKSSTVLGLS